MSQPILVEAGEEATETIRRGPSGLACPTHVLFNGGVMKAGMLRDRLVSVLNSWLSSEGFEPLEVLDASSFDQAVARGACGSRKLKAVETLTNSPRTHQQAPIQI